MTSSYCKVIFNWGSNSSQNVTRYSFVDVESSDFASISYENRIRCNEEVSVVFAKQENEESFTASVVCFNPECSQINGISIDSESRTLEISNDREGYIKTLRGRKISSDSTTAEKTKFFVCSGSFEKSYSSLSIKFLSLGEKESVLIRSIQINLQQHDLKPNNSGNTFDMTKLKKDVDEMGDSVSDKALDFLKTMEIFEQNKMKSLGSLFEQDGLKSKQVQPSFGLSSNSNGLSMGISTLMRSVLGEETMDHLQKDTSKSNGESISQNDSIYSMLQAVCGSVAKTRKSTKPIIDHPAEDQSVEKQQSEIDDSSVNGKSKMNGIFSDFLNQQLEEAKRDMRSEIQTVKEEMMNQLIDMKTEMNEKLENITVLLQTLVNSQTCVVNEGH